MVVDPGAVVVSVVVDPFSLTVVVVAGPVTVVVWHRVFVLVL